MDGDNSMNLVIIYLEEEITISPPESFDSLLDLAQEKFKTFQMSFSYIDENSEMRIILGEDDYQNCILLAKTRNMPNVLIYLEASDKKERRKSSSFQKILKKQVTNNINNAKSYQLIDSNGCVNESIETFGDIRNPKFMIEDIGYSKHSNNRSDAARVYYIKEKKAILRDEQIKRDNEKKSKKEKEQIELNDIDKDFGKRKTKRKKKGDDDD